MKTLKRNLILLLCSGLLLLICGCSQSSGGNHSDVKTAIKLNTGPPEPYKMAIQELESQNFDRTLRYLDLTIKDFPDDKEYIYRAYFLQNMIYMEYIISNLQATNVLLSGVKDNVFMELDEKKHILDYAQATIDEANTYEKPYLQSTTYVLQNYEKYKSISFPLNYSFSIDSSSSIRALEWFSEVGTPVPTTEQLDAALIDIRNYGLDVYFDEILKDNKINYPAYFYAASNISYEWDEELSKKLLQEVIKITENDKYNKYRLDAEDALNKRFK